MKNSFIKKLIFFIPFFFIVSCVSYSTAMYKTYIDRWLGVTDSQMEQLWGYPNKVGTNAQGNTVFIYYKSKSGTEFSYTSPVKTTYNQYTNTYTSTGGQTYGGKSYILRATIWFEFQNHRVIRTSFKGPLEAGIDEDGEWHWRFDD